RATSNRNGGRDHLGILGEIKSVHPGEIIGIRSLAIMSAGLVWFLRQTERGAYPIPALLLMVVGGFWKHNNIAVPLVSLTWLYVVRSKFALQAFRASAEAVLVGLAVCVLICGPNFIPNLLTPRQ
ncbi:MULTISPECIES: hypothetical protein, partial [unclassified Bradyrhizobium]|uniref:hypothetical protein n=1 Tax=unclassified Bradyrhizobium TaxID=2631580 RepID=UPI0033990BBB